MTLGVRLNMSEKPFDIPPRDTIMIRNQKTAIPVVF